MCTEKQWTISSIFCLLNPEFIQVALNPELHKVFWTIPRSAIESRGQRECKMSFTFINFWRKHQITNPFISAHTAEEQWETTMATTRPAPAWCYQKILARCLTQALLRAPLSLLGSLTLPVGETIYKITKELAINTFKLFLTLLCFQSNGSISGTAVRVLQMKGCPAVPSYLRLIVSRGDGDGWSHKIKLQTLPVQH